MSRPVLRLTRSRSPSPSFAAHSTTIGIVVHYQPQVSLSTGRVIGVEALVRWRHTDGALIPPDMFVQLAEAAGLSLDLTWRVLEKATRHFASLSGISDLSISVNLPATALTDVQFPDLVVEQLRGTGLEPRHVHFEVTETSVAREPIAALDILTRLRLKGFALAIDDSVRATRRCRSCASCRSRP